MALSARALSGAASPALDDPLSGVTSGEYRGVSMKFLVQPALAG
jgi:hypothetical protein